MTTGSPKPSTSSRRSFLAVFAAAPVVGCRCEDPSTQVPRPTPPYLRRADVHLHVARNATQRTLEIMDQEGIAWGVNLSGGFPGGTLEAQLEQAKLARGRLVTFTSPPWKECRTPGYGPRLAEQLRHAVNIGARGLKIHKGLGLGIRDSNERLLSVDEPALDLLFEAAGELEVPVWIHTGDPLAFWRPPTPDNERYAELSAHPDWGLFGQEVPSFEDLHAQLERRVARHPKTQFVSVHFGNCAEQPERVARSLRQLPNLHIDTAARVPELGRHPADVVRDFFMEFQDRILFGSDLGVGPSPSPLFLGSSGSSPASDAERRLFFDATRRYFETRSVAFEHPTPIQGDWRIDGIGLSEPLLEKLFVTNASRLLRR